MATHTIPTDGKIAHMPHAFWLATSQELEAYRAALDEIATAWENATIGRSTDSPLNGRVHESLGASYGTFAREVLNRFK